jgi:hypothetical protein
MEERIEFNDGISRIRNMRFAQVIEELPRFTVVERQELLRNVLELDDEGLSDSELALVEQRLAAYQGDPARAVPAETMAERVRTGFSKRQSGWVSQKCCSKSTGVFGFRAKAR